MSRQTQAIINDVDHLAEDARALIAATADAAGEKVQEARQRLAAALEHGKELVGGVRDQAVERVKAADQTVRQYPYQAIGIALGVGAVIGFLVAHRCSCHRG